MKEARARSASWTASSAARGCGESAKRAAAMIRERRKSSSSGRAARAGGAAIEVGELGGRGDAGRAEQAEDDRRERDGELGERLAHQGAGEPAAARLVEGAEALRERGVVAVEPAARELAGGGDHECINS